MRPVLRDGVQFPKLLKKNMMLKSKKQHIEARQTALQKFLKEFLEMHPDKYELTFDGQNPRNQSLSQSRQHQR